MDITIGYISYAWERFLEHYREGTYKAALSILDELERENPSNEKERAERDMVIIEGYRMIINPIFKRVGEAEKEAGDNAEKAEKFDDLVRVIERELVPLIKKK